jgi:hypothetical protein
LIKEPPTINAETDSLPVLGPVSSAAVSKADNGGVKSLTRSFVCIAFVLLLLADVTARMTHRQWSLDLYNSPNRSWVWWNTKDFRQHAQKPDVLLMGSSLMMMALHGADATYLNIPQNVAVHHRSAYLEKLLSSHSKQPVSTFAFALGGQMASDAYVLASTLFHGDKKPCTLVYGIAPRDFMDNTVPSPASTETFRYMERLGDLRKIALSSRTSFWEQTEWVFGQAVFLYGRRLDFVYLQNKYSRQMLKLLGITGLDVVHTPIPLRKLALLELPEDEGPNDLSIMPYSGASYYDNLPEYRMRYKAFKPKLFNMQIGFLEKLLRYCEQQRINVVLVNMPLTQDNVELMPAGFYAHYSSSVQQLASKYHASVWDFQDTKTFPKTLFSDSVHLNGKGGMRFFEVLASRLAASFN